MGANAQTTVPTFTTSQVLTAAQMNQSARTGVPVFANTTDRDAAFGGSGEKTLAEGQLCYLESTDVVQYYNGSTWATLGPSTPGGIVYITGAAFSAVSSVSLPNSTFTSTYKNYKIHFDLTAASVNNAALTMRMRASGTDNTGSNYSSNLVASAYNATTQQNSFTSAGTAFGLGSTRSGYSQDCMIYSFDLQNPQTANITTYTGVTINHVTTSLLGGGTMTGAFSGTTSFDSLTLIVGSGNITGTYRIYGYADS